MSFYDDASLIMYPSGVKSGKIYSQKPTDGSGDLTFTRASTATRVNSSGLIEDVASGVPRIDYTGGGCGRLLLEPQRTNLLTYSEDFSNAWGKTGSTISSNATTSPDGNTNADKLVEDSSTGNHQVSVGIGGLTIGQELTVSIFAKADTRTQFRIDFLPYGNTVFDVSNGTIVSGSDATIENYGNGWYRCSVTRTLTSTSTGVFFTLFNGSSSYTGDGTSGLFFWGAQVEAGSYPTSYIPTSGAAATRVLETYSKSGFQANGIFGATTGTAILDIVWNEVNYVYDFYDTSNIRLRIFNNAGTVFWIRDFIGASWYITDLTHTPKQRCKLGIRWDGTTVTAFQNGVKASTDKTFASSMALDQISNVKLDQERGVIFFPTALSDAEIETLTTL